MLLRKAEFLPQTSIERAPGKVSSFLNWKMCPWISFAIYWIVVNPGASRSSLVQALIIGIQSPGALGHGFPMRWVSMRCCDPVKSHELVEVRWTDVGMREKKGEGKGQWPMAMIFWVEGTIHVVTTSCMTMKKLAYPASPPLTYHQLEFQFESRSRGLLQPKFFAKVPGPNSSVRHWMSPKLCSIELL